MEKSNLVLIGMPGSGKSTLGRRLADDLCIEFLDTDWLIEQKESLPIQTIADRHGIDYLKSVEQSVLCDLKVSQHLLATGGSAVLSDTAMRHLSSIGKIIYLKIKLSTLLDRVENSLTRGLVKKPTDSLADIYHNRLSKYQQWADLTVENDLPLSELRYSEIRQTILSD